MTQMKILIDPNEICFIEYRSEQPMSCNIEAPKKNIFVKKPLLVTKGIFEEYTLQELKEHYELRYRYKYEISDYKIIRGYSDDESCTSLVSEIEEDFIRDFENARKRFQLYKKSRVVIHFKNGSLTEQTFKRNFYALDFINQIKEKTNCLIEIKNNDKRD